MKEQLLQPKLNAEIRVRVEAPPGLTETALRGSFGVGFASGFVLAAFIALCIIGRSKNA